MDTRALCGHRRSACIHLHALHGSLCLFSFQGCLAVICSLLGDPPDTWHRHAHRGWGGDGHCTEQNRASATCHQLTTSRTDTKNSDSEQTANKILSMCFHPPQP